MRFSASVDKATVKPTSDGIAMQVVLTAEYDGEVLRAVASQTGHDVVVQIQEAQLTITGDQAPDGQLPLGQ